MGKEKSLRRKEGRKKVSSFPPPPPSLRNLFLQTLMAAGREREGKGEGAGAKRGSEKWTEKGCNLEEETKKAAEQEHKAH